MRADFESLELMEARQGQSWLLARAALCGAGGDFLCSLHASDAFLPAATGQLMSASG